jgi:nucleotide-binding universal stress UspA family protein
MKKIVVGLDGSAGSIDALHWAVAECAIRNCGLAVVTAWEYPFAYGGLSDAVLSAPDTVDHVADQLEATLVAVVRDANVRDRIERMLKPGSPGDVLVAESKTAELVVVGARGHFAVEELLIGSTTTQLAKHGACPVVVVRSAAKR